MPERFYQRELTQVFGVTFEGDEQLVAEGPHRELVHFPAPGDLRHQIGSPTQSHHLLGRRLEDAEIALEGQAPDVFQAVELQLLGDQMFEQLLGRQPPDGESEILLERFPFQIAVALAQEDPAFFVVPHRAEKIER